MEIVILTPLFIVPGLSEQRRDLLVGFIEVMSSRRERHLQADRHMAAKLVAQAHRAILAEGVTHFPQLASRICPEVQHIHRDDEVHQGKCLQAVNVAMSPFVSVSRSLRIAAAFLVLASLSITAEWSMPHTCALGKAARR